MSEDEMKAKKEPRQKGRNGGTKSLSKSENYSNLKNKRNVDTTNLIQHDNTFYFSPY